MLAIVRRWRSCVFEVHLALATRHVILERRRAFGYRNIVAVESTTVAASPDIQQHGRTLLATFLGERAGTELHAIEAETFTLSIVDGQKVTVDLGIGLSLRGHTGDGQAIAVGNAHVLRVVERQVWDRPDSDRR